MAALLDLRMPGVYTQEIPTLPPTVGVIQSAVPVFIGYTQKAGKKGEDLDKKPTRVKSMKEYTDWFGGPEPVSISVTVDDRSDNPLRPEVRVDEPTMTYKMYYSMLFYYANGGGPCYIVSVGKYEDAISKEALSGAIPLLTKVKDVTIMVFPDGTSIEEAQYASVISDSLMHCAKMKNRVTIIDVNEANGEDLDKIEKGFQQSMPQDIDFKKYGMAYYPYVDTVFSYQTASEEVITVRNHIQDENKAADADLKKLSDAIGAARVADLAADEATAGLKKDSAVITLLHKKLDDWRVTQNPAPDNKALKDQLDNIAKNVGYTIPKDVSDKLVDPMPDPLSVMTDVLKDLTDTKIPAAVAAKVVTKKAVADAVTKAKVGVPVGPKTFYSFTGIGLDVIKDLNNLIYGKIKDAVTNFAVTLPPCGAMAGIYVRTDATQGVWKAPANVSVFAGINASIDIDDDMHASLNSPDSGKAINVIRAYPGRGLLVYGARTLAGNDLEWRYVNVRRTFCFIEDSIARAMQDFVFEPNNQQTWIKVRAMIRSFLNRLWKAGGLYGNTPEDAYEVLVSEPETMSVEDVLSGIMRVFIKVAVARPAEFIVLQYEHKFELVES